MINRKYPFAEGAVIHLKVKQNKEKKQNKKRNKTRNETIRTKRGSERNEDWNGTKQND